MQEIIIICFTPSQLPISSFHLEEDILYCSYGQMRLQVRGSGLVEVLIHPSLLISLKSDKWGIRTVLPMFLLFSKLSSVCPRI
jgi:hypothetical protein